MQVLWHSTTKYSIPYTRVDTFSWNFVEEQTAAELTLPQIFGSYIKWPSIITGTPKCFDLPPCLARLTTLKSPKSCFCIISDTWIGWGVMTWHSLDLPRPRLRGGFAWKIMQIKPFIRCLQIKIAWYVMYTAKNVVEVACAYHLFPPLSFFVQMKDMVLHVCSILFYAIIR